MSSSAKETIARYIRKECIYYPHEQEHFLGKLPGTRYKSQFYLSGLLYQPEYLSLIASEFKKIVEDEIGHWNFQITGREWSSIPLLIYLPEYLLLYGISINSFMIKNKRKTYGRHNFIEGNPNELPVLIVDDLCNSTDSFSFCRKVCRSQEVNLEVLPFIFAVLNKYSYKHYMEDKHEYFDRYLGRDFKALSVVTRDDVFND